MGDRAHADRRRCASQPAGASIGVDRAHVDAGVDRVGSSVGATARPTRAPASVSDRAAAARSPRRAASAWAKQRMPLPLISARLPSALYSTIAGVVAVGVGRPTSSPSAPMPRRRSHSRRASAGAGRRRRRRVDEHDEEVVAEAVVLGERRAVIASVVLAATGSASATGSCVDVDPAYAGVAAEPPLLAHGELAGAHDDRRRRPRRASTRPSRWAMQLLVAERLARRSATGRRALGAARSTSSSRPAAIIACDPLLDALGQQRRVASAGRSARTSIGGYGVEARARTS